MLLKFTTTKKQARQDTPEISECGNEKEAAEKYARQGNPHLYFTQRELLLLISGRKQEFDLRTWDKPC